jgi:hypothetical protein
MKPTLLRPALFSSCLVIALACLAHIACDDGGNAVKEPAPDSGPGPGPSDSGPLVDGGDGGIADCFMNPKTHLEIINACTNAVKITKNPVLTKLYPDGGLPPLN